MECLGRSITAGRQAFTFLACVLLIASFFLLRKPSCLYCLVARPGHVTWGGVSCWIHPCFLDSTASSRRAGRFGCFSLKPTACDKFACFKDSNSVSLRFSSLPSSSNILEAGIPPTGSAGRGLYPRPKPTSECCKFPISKRRNSVTGVLCQGPKISP